MTGHGEGGGSGKGCEKVILNQRLKDEREPGEVNGKGVLGRRKST